jgi:hypothetical protein
MFFLGAKLFNLFGGLAIYVTTHGESKYTFFFNLTTSWTRLGLGARFEHNWRKCEDFHILDWYRDQNLGSLSLK